MKAFYIVVMIGVVILAVAAILSEQGYASSGASFDDTHRHRSTTAVTVEGLAEWIRCGPGGYYTDSDGEWWANEHGSRVSVCTFNVDSNGNHEGNPTIYIEGISDYRREALIARVKRWCATCNVITKQSMGLGYTSLGEVPNVDELNAWIRDTSVPDPTPTPANTTVVWQTPVPSPGNSSLPARPVRLRCYYLHYHNWGDNSFGASACIPANKIDEIQAVWEASGRTVTRTTSPPGIHQH